MALLADAGLGDGVGNRAIAVLKAIRGVTRPYDSTHPPYPPGLRTC